jgi:hypothetical protein
LKRTMMFVVVEPSLRRIMFMLLVTALVASLLAALIANPAEARTRLTAKPSTVDFGEVAVGEPSQVKNVTLKNTGTKSITIFPNISGTNASNFSVKTDPITIKPAKSKAVPVTFTPSGKSETKTGSLVLKDGSGNTVKSVPLRGVVGALPIKATPSSVDFGTRVVGDNSLDEIVTLKNNGTSSVTLTPSITGTNASSFSVSADSITIAPGDSADVSLTFTPSGATGARTGSLDLKDASGNTVGTVALSGTVKYPIEVTPSLINFGEQGPCTVLTCERRSVTLKNIGTSSVTVTPSVTDAHIYQLSSTAPITLAPGNTTVLGVSFVSDCPNGERTAYLQLKDAGGIQLGYAYLTGTVNMAFFCGGFPI